MLVGAVAATPAVAGKRLKTKSATDTVGLNERGSATAACKRGTKAVSGVGRLCRW
jgi:hypothetical protein